MYGIQIEIRDIQMSIISNIIQIKILLPRIFYFNADLSLLAKIKVSHYVLHQFFFFFFNFFTTVTDFITQATVE